MVKRYLLVLALVVFSPLFAEASRDLDSVRESFCKTVLSDYSPSPEVTRKFIDFSQRGEASIDALLEQLYLSAQLPEREVGRVLSLFREDNKWTDIDYSDNSTGGWKATLHATRILALTRSYLWEGTPTHPNPWYRNRRLGEVLHKALGWWFDNMPSNPNWWHNDIGVPRKLATAMVLLKEEMTESELAGVLKVLERSQFGTTGQNKVWLAGNQFMKAMLTDDPDLAKEARKQIAEEIYVTDKEGIQKDWSFHQHGSQMQFGNYGLCFAESVSFWMRATQGTEYEFSDAEITVLENFILEGLAHTVWKGYMDPSACGRQLHINGPEGKALAFAVVAQNMAALGRGKSDAFKQLAMHNMIPEENPDILSGGKYYPFSDYGTYRADGWMVSIRKHSNRTIGYEYTNNENLFAHFSADGAMMLMCDGGEYKNIYPIWDWRKLPGVTSYDDGLPMPIYEQDEDKKNRSSHVGGLAVGDVMASVMELDRDGLHAFKTSFFFNDMVVNLGSDIFTKRAEIKTVTTSIEQNNLRGKVEYDEFWANHDNKSYISLDGRKLKVEIAEQTGTWENMAPVYKGIEAEGKLFRAYFEHDPKLRGESYAYAVVPCTGAQFAESFSKGVEGARKGKKVQVFLPEILRNDASCQAVKYIDVVAMVFHKPGYYELDGKKMAVPDPCIRLVINGKTHEQKLPRPNVDNSGLSFDYSSVPAHPRLYLPKAAEKSIKEAVRKSPLLGKVHNSIMAEADRLLSLPVPERHLIGKRMLSVSRDVLNRITHLGYAYRLSGNIEYASKVREILLAVSSFSDWNPSHFLDAAEMGLAVAVGYDWIYDKLSDDDRNIISDAVLVNLFRASETGNKKFYNDAHNWNSVCNAGLITASLAFYENFPYYFAEHIERSLASLPLAMSAYAPDGVYPEGFSYWEYGTEFQLVLNEALKSVFGHDAKLSHYPGFWESARFITHMQAPSGMCFNYADCSSAVKPLLSLFRFAQLLDDPSVAYLEYWKISRLPDNFKSLGRLAPLTFIMAASDPRMVEKSRTSTPKGGALFLSGEVPLFLYRSDWRRTNATYLGVKGGSASSNHAHMDAGSFVYEFDGVRWSSDLGMQSYESLEKEGLGIWDKEQGSDRWNVFRNNNFTHSTITIDGEHHRVMGFADFVKKYDSKSKRGVTLDMTDIFGDYKLGSAQRTVWLNSNDFLNVEDVIESGSQSIELHWNMLTCAKPEIISANSMVLTVGNKKMVLKVRTGLKIEMLALEAEPPMDYDAPNDGYYRVGFKCNVPSGRKVKFHVTLQPYVN